MSADKDVVNCGHTCHQMYDAAQKVFESLQNKVKNVPCDPDKVLHTIKSWKDLHCWRNHRVQACELREEVRSRT